MINRLTLFLLLTLAFSSCKNKSIEISGKLENPVNGAYLYLDELKADKLETVDSVKLGKDGKFNFKRGATIPAFFLLKTNNSNFFMTLLEPGEKLSFDANYDSLNNP
ncbi:MAG: hypothetical protein C0408_05185, partial [Odoribacter sp.]|nr:hypothetical protein [Odoribacter sp.]